MRKSLILFLIVTLVLSSFVFLIKPASVSAIENKSYILAKKTTTTTMSDEEVKKYIGDNSNICSDKTIMDEIHNYWGIVMIAIPGLLIMMVSIDFFRAIMSSDDDLIKKASTNAIKRTAAAVILFMLPFILDTLFNWFGIKLCL